MRNLFFSILFFTVAGGCGKLPDLSMKSPVTTNNGPQVSNIVAGPYSPASYFKILTEVDSGSDTRIFEMTYKSDGTFFVLQKSYPGGNLSSGYFHKTSGTYSEDKSGNITHAVVYDSCGDMTAKTISINGDATDIINVRVNGKSLSLYSLLSWSYPKSFTSAADTMEDIGCTKFPKAIF